MDKLYSINHLKNLVNDVLNDTVSKEQLTKTLQGLALLDDFDNAVNNAYLLAIYALLKDSNTTPLNKLLLEEIKNQIIFSLIKIENNQQDEKCCYDNVKNNSVPETCAAPLKKKKVDNTLSIYNGIPSEKIPDLDDHEAVKAYFLKKNTFLANPEGNFNYPSPGNTTVITSGDNMTIPGIRYMINYVIDHEGNIVDIKGYPERVLERTNYEDIYQGLIGKLFDNDEE